MPRIVEGPLAADPKIHAGRADQRLGLRQNQIGFDRRRHRHHLVRQALALRGVEDGEALQERDGLRLLAGLRRAPAFVVRREAVGIDDGRAALAFADMTAEAERLAEGQPALASKAVLDDGAPQNEHVDPGVAPLGAGVPGQAERRLRRRRPPGLDPGRTAGLQLGDDLVGDFLIEARPVLAGAGASSVSGHRGSPRRALAEPLSTTLNPSRKTRPHSHSRGVAGCPRRWGCAGDRGAGQGEGVPLQAIPDRAIAAHDFQSAAS